MSQERLTETYDKPQSSLNSSSSFKMEHLPHPITSSLRLGNQLTPYIERIEPHIISLNQKGVLAIQKGNYQQALHLFQEGQRLLEMGAGCGKSIDRQLILTILNNQAHVYQKQGNQELAKKYLEAVIYNIKQYLQNKAQLNLAINLQYWIQNPKPFEEVHLFLKQNYLAVKTFLSRTNQLALSQLQYAYLLVQTSQHQDAGIMAQKAIKSMTCHLKYCKVFQKYFKQRSNENINIIIEHVFSCNKDIEYVEVQKLQNQLSSIPQTKVDQLFMECDALQKKQLLKFQMKDFCQIKSQKYKGSEKSSQKEFLRSKSLKCYIQKCLMLSSAFLLASQQKAKEFQIFQNQSKQNYFFGSKEQFQEIKSNQLTKTKLFLFVSMKIVFNVLPPNSAFYRELLEAQKDWKSQTTMPQAQSYFIQVSQVPKLENTQQKSSFFEEKDMQFPQIRQTQPVGLAPPSVQMNALDLSSADSIDLNSNASMIDALKNVDKDMLEPQSKDQQLYFQFMPKKLSNNQNPLFQATTNLQVLRKDMKKPTGTISNKQSVKIDIEQVIEGVNGHKKKDSIKKIQELVTKIDDQDREFLKSMINKKSKNYSKSKQKKNSILLAHSMSANSIYLSKKSKSKKKSTQMCQLQSVRLNLKTQQLSKRPQKLKIHQNPQGHLKLNKVKSPFAKLKVEKIEVKKTVKSKSKSKEKSLKMGKSKSKSTNKNKSKSKKPSKFESIYYLNKK